jgi:D-methionine transport system ATP-binding protein
VIRLSRVTKAYASPEGPFHALRGIDLEVLRGEIFGIIGRSGAGKSTLLRMLNLLERPTSGEVLLEGQEITPLHGAPLRRLRHRIGMVFQHFNLLASRSVEENVRLPLRVAAELGEAEQRARVRDSLELVGLGGQARKFPQQLSGGQRQRVGIARAIVNRPRLLLCDEPTSALDPETTQSILDLLLHINRQLALTIVLITHSMSVIRRVADRVAVLDAGTLVESGRVVDVFLRPQHPTTRALLAESGIETGSGPAMGAPAGTQVLRLTCRGDVVATPLISGLARELALDVVVLQGSVGRIKDTPYAELTVAVRVSGERLQELLSSLAQREVSCEVLARNG